MEGCLLPSGARVLMGSLGQDAGDGCLGDVFHDAFVKELGVHRQTDYAWGRDQYRTS